MTDTVGRHRPHPDTEAEAVERPDDGGVASHRRPRKLRHHAGRPVALVKPETTVTIVPGLDDETGELSTFELAVPTIDQGVTGYASLRTPSPSRRVATAPVPPLPFPDTPPPRDWRIGATRAGIFLASLGAVLGWLALYRAQTADDQLHAAGVLVGCLVILGAFSGWAIARPVPCRCGRKCKPL